MFNIVPRSPGRKRGVFLGVVLNDHDYTAVSMVTLENDSIIMVNLASVECKGSRIAVNFLFSQ